MGLQNSKLQPTPSSLKKCYLEFGCKEGNYTPAFSMLLLPAEVNGHVVIELDFEIEDNPSRTHRACFYIESELGLIQKLGEHLQYLEEMSLDDAFSLA